MSTERKRISKDHKLKNNLKHFIKDRGIIDETLNHGGSIRLVQGNIVEMPKVKRPAKKK